MPPIGARRPDQAGYDGLVGWLETELDREAAVRPNPGRPLVHRLNRTEYANAIQDLLALDVGDVTSLLPADDSSYGFDNIADVLGVSPLLQERYLAAADRISSLAVGDTEIAPGSETFRLRQDLSQDKHIEGLPLGTVGGIRIDYIFPLDGEYAFDVKLYRNNQGATRGFDYEQRLEIAVDGERVHLASFGGNAELAKYYENVIPTSDEVDARLRVRVPVKAGPRSVTVAFIEKPGVQDTKRLEPFQRSSFGPQDHTGYPHIETVTIGGPFNASGSGDTPSRRRLFVCRPAAAASEETCARQVIGTVARRAYRRPIPVAELEQLVAFYRDVPAPAAFDKRIQLTLRRILASPKFVFRVEPDPPGTAPGATYRISDVELASRLSFFLWSSIPDDELLTLASQDKLRTPAVLERQVRRMLADPKAGALGENFAGQWLQLRNLANVIPDPVAFPDFDDNLRNAFAKETQLLFTSIAREDRSVVDLLTADYTFVNERLAKHYRIPNVYGSQFRRVPVKDETRLGILGQGSMLTVTSHSATTSPVLRGKWILENIYGTPPPPPPPNVPALEPEGESGPLTIRQQMEKHRSNAVCASCHRLMDPIGFALENFDAVGAWRSRDVGAASIDASGQLSDGTQVNGVVTLRQAIVKRSDVFARTLTEKLMTYALGRGLSYHDMPVVRTIVRSAARHNYRFSTVVLGIVNSAPFRMRINQVQEPESARAAAR